jgi:2'-5' RNA ligase
VAFHGKISTVEFTVLRFECYVTIEKTYPSIQSKFRLADYTMPRLFIAVDLPETIRDNLASMSFGIPGAKWTPPEQLHLTVRFIGEVDGALFREIKDALVGISYPPFSMQLRGVGFFPPRGAPRVLWAGVEKSEPLQVLKKKIDQMLFRAGVEPDARKFSPHITLARLKNSPVQKIANFLAGNGLFSQEPFQVDNFKLYSSILSSKGAYHKVEKVYSLSAAEGKD